MKKTFITDAKSGFGEACTHKFAEQGHDLILNGRPTERFSTLTDALEKKSNIAEYQIPFDVLDKHTVTRSINLLSAE